MEGQGLGGKPGAGSWKLAWVGLWHSVLIRRVQAFRTVDFTPFRWGHLLVQTSCVQCSLDGGVKDLVPEDFNALYAARYPAPSFG